MNRRPMRVGLGASSMLLIVVMLCLTVFSVLALVSARADARLAARTAEAAEAYAAADRRAQVTIMEIDTLLSAGQDPSALEGVSVTADGGFEFSVPVRDGMVLSVRLTGGAGALETARYRTEPDGAQEQEAGVKLWGE